MQSHTGRIAKLTDRGFGFIACDDPDLADCFVHATSVVNRAFKSLRVDDGVQFTVRQEPRGPRAEHVEMLEG